MNLPFPYSPQQLSGYSRIELIKMMKKETGISSFNRLADLYLMASEANALKPAADQTKALMYLNEVRMRAYGVNDVSALPVISSVDIDVILEERAKELAQEGKRWFDLVRTGKLVERVRMHNPEAAPNIQDHHVLRPIPLSQIDRTSTDFPQNPGY